MHTAGSKETCHMLELESKGNPTVLEPVILGVIHIVLQREGHGRGLWPAGDTPQVPSCHFLISSSVSWDLIGYIANT